MNENNTLLENILKRAEEERFNLKHPYVGSEHLFLSLLKTKNNVSNYLKSYNITYGCFKKELVSVVGKCTKDNPSNLYTPLLRKIIKRSETVNSSVEDIYENLFLSLLDEGEGIAIRILLKMNIDLDEIYIHLKEKEKLNKMEESNKIGILLNNTIELNDKVICRDKEIEKVILTLLRKKKCNPLLIGPAGVGKTAIIEELTRRIEKHLVPDELLNNKVYMIEMGSLISGTRYRGEFEERLNKIIKEVVNNKKSIIFIDEIHSMVGAGGAEGAINASDILKPYLARGDIKIIGATTTIEYNNTILKDKALSRRFEPIDILEPSNEDMIELLLSIKKEYESYHKIHIPNKIIDKIINLSDIYLKNIVNPDKSIDLLDSSCAYAKIKGKDTLTEDDVIDTIYNKTNNYTIKNKEFIFKLSASLNKYLNKNTIKDIINIFKYKTNLPISFIFDNKKIKDLIVNELGNINTINIDLNNPVYIEKNISENIYNNYINKPYSLININHIENASKIIIDEIININNDGYIILKNNEKLYFNNAIIILNINNNDIYNTGFNKSTKTKVIDKKLVDSFKLDLRNITLKDNVIS